MAQYKNPDLMLGCTTLVPQRISGYIFSFYLVIVCIELLSCPECGPEDKLYKNVGSPHKRFGS